MGLGGLQAPEEVFLLTKRRGFPLESLLCAWTLSVCAFSRGGLRVAVIMKPETAKKPALRVVPRRAG